MARLPDIDVDRLTPEQRKVHDDIVAGPRGKVEGPLRVWLTSPALAARAQELGAFCRYHTSLPPRLSELAILVTAAHWRAGFEWRAHEQFARKAGLPEVIIQSIKAGTKPNFQSEDEAAVHGFAHELLEKHRVSDAIYARAAAALGIAGVVDLVGILGYYGLISMTINAFEIPAPDGAPEPFAERK
jgi:4-carboxymuconolactone decarboxylase